MLLTVQVLAFAIVRANGHGTFTGNSAPLRLPNSHARHIDFELVPKTFSQLQTSLFYYFILLVLAKK